MRRLEVDQRKCLAYGVCTMTAPALFDLPDDEEVAHVMRQPETDEEWIAADEAVAGCPSSAISIVEEVE